MPELQLAPLPANEAIAFFRAKGARIETQFDWRDWDARAHATAFTVAKSTVADVAGDIHASLLKTLEGGGTFEQFKRALVPTLQAKGWWGKAHAVDPATGETKLVQLGSDRRLKVIFDTNLRMAYAHGQWQRVERRKADAPWLRYVAVLDDRTRPEHRAWHGTTLPIDDKWWDTHLPPCGWNCRCTVQQLSDRDLERLGITPSQAGPDQGTKTWVNSRTGQVEQVPKGIDPGFAHNVGRIGLEEHAAQFYMDRLGALPAELATAASRASAPVVLPALQRGFDAWSRQVDLPDFRVTGERRAIGLISPAAEAALRSTGTDVRAAALTISDRELRHAQRPGKRLRDQPVPSAVLARLPSILARPKAILLDQRDLALVYVADVPGETRLAKFIFKPFRQRGQDLGKATQRLDVTAFVSAGLVEPGNLSDPRLYRLVSGSL